MCIRDRVNALSNFFRDKGIKKGDVIVGYLPNIPDTVISFLSAAKIGAVWSSCSADFGTQAVIDRFSQLKPKLLIVADYYFYNGKKFQYSKNLWTLKANLNNPLILKTSYPSKNNSSELKKIYNSEVPLPSSLVDAKKISEQKSPDLIIAEIEYGQSELDVKIARSDLSPTAKLSLERSYTDDLSATYDEREKDVLQATVSWPFQFGGKNKSNINKNLQVKGMKKLLLENAFRNNTQGVTAAWSTLESSKSLLRAVQSQVKAAEIANEGISFEYESGLNRSTFDVLQSRSNLINAKINLAEAERNYLLAQYKLLKSAGLLNSEYLKLR